EAAKKPRFTTLDKVKHVPVDWLIESVCARGKISGVCAEPGGGKSLLVQMLFQFQDRNTLSLKSKPGLKCFYVVGGDMVLAEIKNRQQKTPGCYNIIINEDQLDIDFSKTESTDKFISDVEDQNFDVIVLDTTRNFYAGDSSCDEIATKTMNSIRRVAEKLNCAIILLDHVVKSHASISINSWPGSAKWGGNLDQAFYIQRSKDDIFQLHNIKNRLGGDLKFLKYKYLSPEIGLTLTDEEFVVNTILSTNALATTGDGPGRPAKISLEESQEVLSDLPAEFWTRDFITKAENRDLSERTAYRMLDLLEAAGNTINGGKRGSWIKKLLPKSDSGSNDMAQNNFGSSENGQNELKTAILPFTSHVTANITPRGDIGSNFGSNGLLPTGTEPI
ncbi:MAG: AAA family ATPase, partial [Chlorobiales bacterium]|nr:AAA family ATPase [Chlorobiales bacterium]